MGVNSSDHIVETPSKECSIVYDVYLVYLAEYNGWFCFYHYKSWPTLESMFVV
jgi:hypothetical protein